MALTLALTMCPARMKELPHPSPLPEGEGANSMYSEIDSN